MRQRAIGCTEINAGGYDPKKMAAWLSRSESRGLPKIGAPLSLSNGAARRADHKSEAPYLLLLMSVPRAGW